MTDKKYDAEKRWCSMNRLNPLSVTDWLQKCRPMSRLKNVGDWL